MPNQKIKIAILSILLLVVFANNYKAQDTNDTPIKVDTILLNIPVIVSDKSGRNIAGLKKENFSIYQDGEKQSIDFFADQEAPMNVAIVIDASGSTINVLGV